MSACQKENSQHKGNQQTEKKVTVDICRQTPKPQWKFNKDQERKFAERIYE